MIEVDNLSKTFGGRPAVRNISFQVPKGEILGLLGPNGAGKTTTMRILTCYLPATSGTARIDGYDVFEQSMEVRRRVGYLPETPPLYEEMTVRSYLEFVGRIKGVAGRDLKSRVALVTERCGIGDVLRRIIGHLSKGYRQRVGLAQALIGDPSVLVLDEPTIGLDPAQIVEIRQLVKSLAGEHTIVFSTHILPEVTSTCSRVVIINSGRAVMSGPLSELGAGRSDGHSLHLQVARDGGGIAEDLLRVEGVRSVNPDGPRAGSYRLGIDPSADVRERIAGRVVERGWGLLEMTPVGPSLEEIYLSLTGGDADRAAA